MAATGDSRTVDTFDFNQEDLVTLLVGPEQKKMVVHGTYLARDSDYFEAALKKEWIEGQTRTINLHEDCPEVMTEYISYTYSKALSTKSNPHNEPGDLDHSYRLLATLYVYGERFINPTIQKAVIQEIFRLTDVVDISGTSWSPSENEVNIIYRGTSENSPARRFMINLHRSKGDKSWISEKLEPAFLVDLAKAFYERCLEDEITLKLEDYI
jgi:hypothetical protein